MPRTKSGSKRAVSRRFPTKTRNFRGKVTRKTKRNRKNNKTVKGGGLFDWLNNTNINVKDLLDPNTRSGCVYDTMWWILTGDSRSNIYIDMRYKNADLNQLREDLGITDENMEAIKKYCFAIQDKIHPDRPNDVIKVRSNVVTEDFKKIVEDWKTEKDKPENIKLTSIPLFCQTQTRGKTISNSRNKQNDTRFIDFAIKKAKIEILKIQTAHANVLPYFEPNKELMDDKKKNALAKLMNAKKKIALAKLMDNNPIIKNALDTNKNKKLYSNPDNNNDDDDVEDHDVNN